MIRKIILRNFQIHQKLAIDLDPRVTTVVGPSDSGKSAIVRAAKWVCLNRPSGAAFVRKGAAKCSVTVGPVRRVRTKSRNEYRVGGKVSKAFGQDVPAPARDALNVHPENIQGQHDPPFWLSLNPGDFAKALNEVVDLSLIDRAVGSLNKEARKAEAEVSVTRERLKEAKTERDAMAPAVAFDAALREVERLKAEADAARERADRLRSVAGKAASSRRKAREGSEAVRRTEGAFAGLESRRDAARDARRKAANLRAAIDAAGEVRLLRDSTAAEAEAAEAELASVPTCPTCGNPT